jgi:hypothetical protein
MLRSATPATAVSYPQIELMPVPYPPDLIGVVVGAMVPAATAELVAAPRRVERLQLRDLRSRRVERHRLSAVTH